MTSVIRSLRGNSVVARNVGWSLFSESFRLLASLAVFLILTRRYDPDEYGVLVGAIALLAFVLPQATVGSSYLLLKRVAGLDWTPEVALRRLVGTVALGGSAVTLVLLALRPLVIPQLPWEALVLLCVSELIMTGMLEGAVFLAQALQRLRAMALARMTYGVCRLAAAIVLVATTSNPPLWLWAALAAASAGVAALVGQVATVGRPVLPSAPTADDVKQGIPFSVGFGADKLREGTDQVLLVRLDREVDAGIYGAAIRIVGMSMTPALSLVHALNARFFAAGRESRAAASRLARRAVVAGLLVTVPMGVVFALGGSTIARILPADYADTGPALVYMAVLPTLMVLEIFPGMALTAIGRHRQRVVFNLGAAATNVVLDLLWIPDHGWKAAVVATIISGVAYIAVLWTLLERAVAEERAAGVPLGLVPPAEDVTA
jgi:O-antigen/teichoic acid export membrane protein